MEKILESKVLYRGKRFNVTGLKIELSPGNIVLWEAVDKGGNSVAMIPIDEKNNIYLVEEYFGAVNKRMLCLPKGMVDAGETNEEAALRELQEEIGLKGKLKQLTIMDISPSYLTQKTILYLVTELVHSKLEGDEREYIRTVKLPITEAFEKVMKGEITEARTITGIILAKNILKL
ncbi:NUDIX domain-containing protein [Desulfobacula phenolica]|uniref:ADP-ribose diphosphatase n=1 Tax=Desulfobacula phenolica TaxID=90732 RepID=A0A1H2ECQ1_9BACT|nr:NUDIX domain-containing protein [Desulfobacula phenolica]SDT92803.1 ADP-ribose diphosphatase [Desulfobacula phenolica]